MYCGLVQNLTVGFILFVRQCCPNASLGWAEETVRGATVDLNTGAESNWGWYLITIKFWSTIVDGQTVWLLIYKYNHFKGDCYLICFLTLILPPNIMETFRGSWLVLQWVFGPSIPYITSLNHQQDQNEYTLCLNQLSGCTACICIHNHFNGAEANWGAAWLECTYTMCPVHRIVSISLREM